MSGTTRDVRGTHSKRVKHRLAYPLSDPHSARLSHNLAEDIEALVGVDATLPRSGDRTPPLEGQTRGMGEQMANRGPFGTCRIVEGDQASFDRDQHRPRDDRLGNRREREHAINIAVRVDDVAPDTKDEGGIEGRQRSDHAVVASGAAAAAAAYAAAVVFSLILRSVRA